MTTDWKERALGRRLNSEDVTFEEIVTPPVSICGVVSVT